MRSGLASALRPKTPAGRRFFFCSIVLVAALGSGACRAQEVRAEPGGFAVGRDIRDSSVIIGIPSDQLPAIIKAAIKDRKLLTEQQKQTIETLQNDLGVN